MPNVLDAYYKGQAQEFEQTKSDQDRQHEQFVRRSRLLARDVYALDTEEKWNQLGPEVAKRHRVPFRPWDGGVHRDRILAMGAEMDPQTLNARWGDSNAATSLLGQYGIGGKTDWDRAQNVVALAQAKPELMNDPAFSALYNSSMYFLQNRFNPFMTLQPGGTALQKPPLVITQPGAAPPVAPQPGAAPPVAPGAPVAPSQDIAPRPGATAPSGGLQPVAQGAVPEPVITADTNMRSEVANLGVHIGKLNEVIKSLDDQSLKLGGWTNLMNEIRNTGLTPFQPTEGSRAYSTLISTLEQNRNDILLLAKGTQTEGDARRAMDAIIQYKTDPIQVRKQLENLRVALESSKREKEQGISVRQQQYPGLSGNRPTGAPATEQNEFHYDAEGNPL